MVSQKGGRIVPGQSLEDDAPLATTLDTADKLGSYPKTIHRLQREGKHH
jgi:hypothetical protein